PRSAPPSDVRLDPPLAQRLLDAEFHHGLAYRAITLSDLDHLPMDFGAFFGKGVDDLVVNVLVSRLTMSHVSFFALNADSSPRWMKKSPSIWSPSRTAQPRPRA